MKLSRIAKNAHELANPFRVEGAHKFRLKDYDPGDTLWLKDADKPHAIEALRIGIEALAELQERLYAQDKWAILLIFQALDAAGKDGVIKHVMSGINPQGCQVRSFKAPTSEELDHDYLWRCMNHLPERGRIGIFNRSYYEETLVVRVHPEILQKQNLPPELITKNIWKHRFEDIRGFERYLSRNGILVRKFFLNVSREEQKKRFMERLTHPEKHWKFASGDLHERKHWRNYMEAYEDTIRHTATPESPWYVVPADNKWFTRTVVAAAIIDALWSLDLEFPKINKLARQQLEIARQHLEQE